MGHDDRHGIGIPHVAAVIVDIIKGREFPQHIIGIKGIRSGHVKGVHPLAALAQGADQQRGRTEFLPDSAGGIHVEAVLVERIGQFLELAVFKDKAGDIGPFFGAVGVIKGVQHAVVGAHEEGVADMDRRAMNDVPQQGPPGPEGPAVGRVIGTVAPDKIDDILLLGLGRSHGRLLAGREVIPRKGHAIARGRVVGENLPRRPVGLIGIAQHLPGRPDRV